MSNPLPLVAPLSHSAALSFKVMQTEALYLISAGCNDKGIRGPRELSVRAGLPEEKTVLVYHNSEGKAAVEILPLNGQEWDDLLTAVDVSKEMWIEKSFANNPEQIDDDDKVISLPPQYGAASDGRDPSEETRERIGVILGYSSAFYLKASGVMLPQA